MTKGVEALEMREPGPIVQAAANGGDNAEAARQLEEVKVQLELAKTKTLIGTYLSTP